MATSLLIPRATVSLVTMFMSRIRRARHRAQADFEARFAALEAKEEIRSVLTDLARIVDEGLLSGLSKLEPRLRASFTMRVVDLAGTERQFIGAKGLVDAYAPIMASGRARLIASVIAVVLDGDRATASFKLAGAIKTSLELGLPPGQRILLVSGHTAKLVRDGGVWKLASLELVHAMANPEAEQVATARRPRRASTTRQEARPKAASKPRSRAKRAAK
jgi:hypothetical protein